MRTVSDSFQSDSQKLNSGNAILELLDVIIFENDGTTTIDRYVNNNVDITSNTNLYNKASFQFSIGSDSKETLGDASLDFDSGNLNIIRKLREVDKRPEVELRIVSSANLDVVEAGPIKFKVESAQTKDTVTSINLTVEPVLGQPIPFHKYTPKLFPNLWL